MIRCNGINLMALQHPIIPEPNYPQFDELINQLRLKFLADHSKTEWGSAGKYFRGVRFNSNRDVMVRIVSACDDIQRFDNNRAAWIKAALDDCARADHWYEYEKDYGWPVVEETEESAIAEK